MANIQIGKYKRPGIFLEEFDQSVISSPVVEGPITNLVIGSSKKGPINTPIRVTTVSDLEAIFGPLDRQLERKGSFFHRTISKMLETAPVFAMNLLLTDDELDRIEYKSISSSSGFKNDVKREGPYRRFFDTTGFWKRDTDSFINLTKSDMGYTERAFNITNLSDRPISVFIIKSTITGFDRTIIEWYGSIDRMPTYVNAQDFASDYLVDVLVVGGDWSNYQELAVDPRWSAYFNASGLRKEQLRNFANDRNVSLLAFYEGLSLIPFFRDLNGRNIFIENAINRDTDRTGLFCAFNNDLVEEDFYNGRLDLIGNTIVGKNETEIDFLSYKELISEEITITSTPLDLPGNVIALLGSPYGYNSQARHAFDFGFGNEPTTSGIVQNSNRTAWFTEGSVFGLKVSEMPVGGFPSILIEFESDNGFAVIGGEYIELETKGFTIEASSYPESATSSVITFYLSPNGEINSIRSESNSNPSVSQNDIVLGYITTTINNGEFGAVIYNPVTIDEGGFIDMEHGDDYEVENLGNGSISVTFLGTIGQPTTSNYQQFRRFRAFRQFVSALDNPNRVRSTMNLGPTNEYEKVSLRGATITNIVEATSRNKSFTLNGLPSDELKLQDILDGYLVAYAVDNEFILGKKSVVTKNEVANLTEEGVVAEFSTFYSRFFNGIINTRDFFFPNRLYLNGPEGFSNELVGESVDVIFIDGEDAPNGGLESQFAGYDYIIFHSPGFGNQVDLQNGEQIVIPQSNRNSGSFTLVADPSNINSGSSLANALGYVGNNFFAYRVNEEVEGEELFGVNKIYDFKNKVYLKMYLENTGELKVRFRDELLQAQIDVDTIANNTITIQSRKSNLKQTLEIEIPDNYTEVPNKVLVNAARYTEVKVGDFLEAYVDEEDLEFGETPRRLTRVLSKRLFAGDTSLTEITCDARIRRYNFSGDIQTMRYVSIDNYATTYKSIVLKGFKLRQDSLPDGTESKQNQILNIVAKGSPLFKALTNKEAIDFRYLIDSFGLGLTERSKQQLVDICGSRLDCFGFINMPSIKSFKNSSSPSFVNSEGVLQAEFIAKGGDPESNPAFLYSFGDGSGSTCVGYFTPYVTVNDNGRPLDMPPSSHVATTYMRKHISNITSITPWTIAAGVTNGRITNIAGIEIDFTPEDIEFLNQAQINPIVFKRNRGFVIETQNTAQTLFSSALSLINVREVLVELSRELANMLLDYQWKFNTPDVRAEIKLRADTICETYVSRNGLFNYFNKMDDENNTPELIDNQIGVLDTYVEPIKGMGIIVNNITILRTGAISAGGFINP